LKILFECDHSEVRPISGTNSNEAFFSRFVNPGDVVMVNSTPAGGHISHHREGSLGKFTKNIIDIPLTADGYHMDVAKATYLIEKAKPKLDRHGFDVQGKEFDFTETHQVAVNVREFRGGEKVSKTLEINEIILNMNMLPHEPLKNHDRPDGIRIGVQEMTRFGMGEKAMGRIAELIKECIIDKKPVKEEVNRFRAKYRKIKYSYDSIKEKNSVPVKSKHLKN